MFTHSDVRIGVVSSPMPSKHAHKAESYMNRDYLSWVEMSGAKAILVPYNTKELGNYLDHLHGVVFCGGAIENEKTHPTEQYDAYLQTFRTVFAYAKRYDLPLWGTCLGFELMALMGEPPSPGTFFSSENLQPVKKIGLSPLRFTEGSTRLKAAFPLPLQKKMAATPFCRHLHKYGFRLDAPHFKVLQRYLDVVSVDETSDGTTFVNMFEFKERPFYGCQWHPEKVQNRLGAKVAKRLSEFFRDECRAHRGPLDPLQLKSGPFDQGVLVKGGKRKSKTTKQNQIKVARTEKRKACPSSRRNA